MTGGLHDTTVNSRTRYHLTRGRAPMTGVEAT